MDYKFTNHVDGFDVNELVLVLHRIYHQYGTKILRMKELMNAINALFNEFYHIQKYNLFVFLIFFAFPFWIQLFTPAPIWIKIICLIMCCFNQIYFLFIEAMQFITAGFSYFKNPFNLFELTLIVGIFYYTFDRMIMIGKYPERDAEILPPIDEKGATADTSMPIERHVYWTFFNSILVINTAIKTMQYMRVYASFSLLVQLVIKVVRDAYIFFFFFFCWVAMFSYLMQIAGTSIKN